MKSLPRKPSLELSRTSRCPGLVLLFYLKRLEEEAASRLLTSMAWRKWGTLANSRSCRSEPALGQGGGSLGQEPRGYQAWLRDWVVPFTPEAPGVSASCAGQGLWKLVQPPLQGIFPPRPLPGQLSSLQGSVHTLQWDGNVCFRWRRGFWVLALCHLEQRMKLCKSIIFLWLNKDTDTSQVDVQVL